MTLDNRVGYLLLGMFIGFILGYVVRLLREIKEELDEMIEHQDWDHKRDESGFMRYPIAADLAVLVVVAITAYAAFVSQVASNNSHTAVNSIAAVSDCNSKFISDTLVALNQRATYSADAIKANQLLQKDQRDFFVILLHKPPYTHHKLVQSTHDYVHSLNHYLAVSNKNLKKLQAYSLPSSTSYSDCLSGD